MVLVQTDRMKLNATRVVLEELAQRWHEELNHAVTEGKSFKECKFNLCKKAKTVIEEGVVLL